MINIWHQSFTDLSTMPIYSTTLDEHARRILSEGTTVKVHGLRPGTYEHGVAPIDAIKHRYLEFLNESQICEAALAAEREGFDALAIGCFFDPALRLARSIVDIPVVSLAESCMLIASSIGRKFGLVTLCVEEVGNLYDLAKLYGLSERLASVVGVTPGIDEFSLEGGIEESLSIIANFKAACEVVIEAGAEVIIPGDGVLNEFLVRHNVTEINAVPILDSIGALFHHAEMLVKLRRSTGLTVSRRHFYAKPPQTMMLSARSFAGMESLGSTDFSSADANHLRDSEA